MATTLCEGIVSVRAGGATGAVVAVLEDGTVAPSVLASVRLPATLPAPPEPQPVTLKQEPNTTSATATTARRRTRSTGPAGRPSGLRGEARPSCVLGPGLLDGSRRESQSRSQASRVLVGARPDADPSTAIRARARS